MVSCGFLWKFVLKSYRGKTYLEQLVVTPGMTEAKIKLLKDNKSPGADGISPRLLKEIVDDINY